MSTFSHSVSYFLTLITVSLDEMFLILMKLQFIKILVVILFVPCLRTLGHVFGHIDVPLWLSESTVNSISHI